MLNKLFKLEENHTNVKTEVLAGITTFMTMAYILAVNPTKAARQVAISTAVASIPAAESIVGFTARI